MADLRSDAKLCYAILCHCITNNSPATSALPLHKAMRSLQKRYGGAFPAELKRIWGEVTHPDPDLDLESQSEANAAGLQVWFELEYSFTKEDSNAEETGSKPEAGEGESVERRNSGDWFSEVEKGTSPSKESDPGHTSGGKRKKRRSKSSENS